MFALITVALAVAFAAVLVAVVYGLASPRRTPASALAALGANARAAIALIQAQRPH